jgi:hypothetical protein
MKRLAAATLALSLLAVAVLVLSRDGDEPDARTPEPAAYTRVCDAGSIVRAFPATKRDARLGPATLGGFRGLFENAKAREVYQPRPGVFSLKAALVFAGRSDLTLAIAPSVRNVLKLDYGGPREGYPSVRFRACARQPGDATGYPGGFVYTGPWPACVPIDVSVGDGRPQRHVLSFGAGRCPAPR